MRQLSKLFDELIDSKIALVSIKDSFDLSTATGRLIAHIMSSVAQYEVELDGERVRAGQAVARANGQKWGGTKRVTARSSPRRSAPCVNSNAKECQFCISPSP